MIELFNLLKDKKSRSVKIKSERISFWKPELKRIEELINYIKNNEEIFITHFKVNYDTTKDKRYIKSFDIEFETNEEVYNYLSDIYGDIFDKYNKRTIALNEIQFMNWNKDFSRLRIH